MVAHVLGIVGAVACGAFPAGSLWLDLLPGTMSIAVTVLGLATLAWAASTLVARKR
jgi:hypothetical protein